MENPRILADQQFDIIDILKFFWVRRIGILVFSIFGFIACIGVYTAVALTHIGWSNREILLKPDPNKVGSTDSGIILKAVQSETFIKSLETELSASSNFEETRPIAPARVMNIGSPDGSALRIVVRVDSKIKILSSRTSDLVNSAINDLNSAQNKAALNSHTGQLIQFNEVTSILNRILKKAQAYNPIVATKAADAILRIEYDDDKMFPIIAATLLAQIPDSDATKQALYEIYVAELVELRKKNQLLRESSNIAINPMRPYIIASEREMNEMVKGRELNPWLMSIAGFVGGLILGSIALYLIGCIKESRSRFLDTNSVPSK